MRSCVNEGLVIGPVTNLPRFPDGRLVDGDGSAERGANSCPAPNPFFEERREGEGMVKWDRHISEGGILTLGCAESTGMALASGLIGFCDGI